MDSERCFGALMSGILSKPMRKILLIAVILVGSMILYGQQVVGDVDQAAQITAFQVWGPAAYAAKYANGEGPWIYEVGFQSMFGGRIAVGRGDSWQAAFDAAKVAIATPPSTPFGKPE